MKNDHKFFNIALSSGYYSNILSSRKSIDSNGKTFLSRGKYKENNKRFPNNRYNNKYKVNKNFSNSIVNNNNTRNKIYRSIEINKENNIQKDNNPNYEYNIIISLLDRIIKKDDSYNILIKIKKFIYKLINETREKKNLINSSMCLDFFHPNDIKYSTSKNSNSKIQFNNEKNRDNEKNNNLYNLHDIKDKNENNNSFNINRQVKKLYNKINKIEEKSNIEQLKFLFFIVEQEKKIAELEKNFEIKEIPLDERIIEKMRELKCLPNFFNEGLNLKKEKLEENNNKTIKSRNKLELKKKFSLDKEIEPILKRNKSAIMNKRDNKMKNGKVYFSERKIDYQKNKNIVGNDNYNKNVVKINKIEINFSKPINHFFNQKNFFLTHPRLNYIKNSIEKNHFLKLKTKEQLSGDTNLLSNMNLASKSHKIMVNDFSSFINNSMVNFEKIKK